MWLHGPMCHTIELNYHFRKIAHFFFFWCCISQCNYIVKSKPLSKVLGKILVQEFTYGKKKNIFECMMWEPKTKSKAQSQSEQKP